MAPQAHVPCKGTDVKEIISEAGSQGFFSGAKYFVNPFLILGTLAPQEKEGFVLKKNYFVNLWKWTRQFQFNFFMFFVGWVQSCITVLRFFFKFSFKSPKYWKGNGIQAERIEYSLFLHCALNTVQPPFAGEIVEHFATIFSHIMNM